MVNNDNEKRIDESLRLLAMFIRVKDPKARLEVIRLAEQYAQFGEALTARVGKKEVLGGRCRRRDSRTANG